MTGNRIWVLGTGLAILAVLALGWVLGVSPKLAEADAALEQQVNVDAQNAIHEATLVHLRKEFERLGEIETELAELRKEIPEAAALEPFIDSIHATAAKAGVEVVRISTTEASGLGAANGEETAADISPNAPQAFTIGITVEVKGAPAAVVNFSERMQLSKRLFFAPQFSFDAKGETGTLTGYVYVLRGQAAPEVADEEPAETGAEDAAP